MIFFVIAYVIDMIAAAIVYSKSENWYKEWQTWVCILLAPFFSLIAAINSRTTDLKNKPR